MLTEFGRNKKKFVVPAMVVFVSGLGWVMETDIIPFDFSLLPWNFSSACFSLGFFAIGNEAMRNFTLYEERFGRKLKSKLKLFIMLLISFAVMIPVALRNGKVSIGSRELHNGILFYITGITGSCGILFLSALLKKSKLLHYLGRNSFTIMGSHKLIASCFEALSGIIASPFLTNKNIEFITVLSLTILFVAIYNRILKNINIRRSTNGRVA